MIGRSGTRLRRAAPIVCGLAVVIATAVLVNAAGIRLAGDADHWMQWMRGHTNYFRAWRLLLYVGTALGWIWMRRRVLQREPSPDARRRLMRLEIATVMALTLLEGSVWLHG